MKSPRRVPRFATVSLLPALLALPVSLDAAAEPLAAGAPLAPSTAVAPSGSQDILDATLLLLRKDYAGAESLLNTMIEQDPDDLSALATRGWARIEQGDEVAGGRDIGAAIGAWNTAIEEDPANGRLYYLRGSAYRWARHFDRAIPDLERAVELSPKRSNYPLDLRATEAERSLSEASGEEPVSLDGSPR